MATGLRRIDNATRAVRVLDYRYPYVLYEYDGSGDMVYMGRHPTHGTATSATDWQVTKITYGSDGITKWETLEGAWDDRSTLAWS